MRTLPGSQHMMGQEKPQPTTQLSIEVASPFTSLERTELEKFRDQILQQPDYLKRVMVEKRLLFAKYLKDLGEINDGC